MRREKWFKKTALIVMVLGIAGGIATAREATYEGADLKRAQELRDRALVPEVRSEDAGNLERVLDDERRLQESAGVVLVLEAAREEWRETSRQLDEELMRSIRKARRDAVLRGWATVMNLVALASEFGSELMEPKATDVSEEAKTAAESVGDASQYRDGTVKVEQEVSVVVDGEWRTIRYQIEIQEPPRTPRGVTIQDFKDALSQYGVPRCHSEWGGCVVSGWGELAQSPSDAPARKPTSAEVKLFDQIGRTKNFETEPQIELTAEDRKLLRQVEDVMKVVKGTTISSRVLGLASLNPVLIGTVLAEMWQEGGSNLGRVAAGRFASAFQEHVVLELCSKSSCPLFERMADYFETRAEGRNGE